MRYPQEFSLQARAGVEAEQLKARQEFAAAKGEMPPAGSTTYRWELTAFYKYVLRVFLAFVREAGELGRQRTWAVDRVRSESEEFLRRFANQAHYEDGRDRTGKAFPEVTSNLSGNLSSSVTQSLRERPEWHEFEAALLAVAERQAGIEAGRPIDAAMSRREAVDAFILKCQQETSRKVTRRHIWSLAGHQGPRQFQFWQALDPKATRQDDKNFRRLLKMNPQAFVDLMEKKGLT